MKFAICNEMYEGWDIARICKDAAACGYQGLEIAPFTLDPDPRKVDEKRAREIGQIASDAGIVVTGFHWLLVKPDGLHITTPDAAVRARTAEFLKHLARLCAAAGGKFMVFGSPKQRNVLEGETYEDAFKRAADVFGLVSRTCEQLGVTLALEPLGKVEGNFLNTAEETIKLIEAVNHPNCRLHLDVKAMCCESKPIPQIIAESARHLAYFHANDANRRGPGFGEVDFVPIWKALQQVRYDGWVSVEVFDYKPDPHTIALKSLEYMKKTMEAAK
ncbi:MAG: D-tagatose 3-epimerase [Planctomycetes bacterium ADurb.Bin126]|nr:MAG: D-tagatose 3-epimerase [Planctomycetes bacterium ADurb.Bin126]HOD82073.1 sugar phosphate isomerase/epimerase family protein [Phycisphaerae bacterium]HQL73541.1 sugar phosphate isomerase/epimerase family protein [Phycisphaerae bacterium]